MALTPDGCCCLKANACHLRLHDALHAIESLKRSEKKRIPSVLSILLPASKPIFFSLFFPLARPPYPQNRRAVNSGQIPRSIFIVPTSDQIRRQPASQPNSRQPRSSSTPRATIASEKLFGPYHDSHTLTCLTPPACFHNGDWTSPRSFTKATRIVRSQTQAFGFCFTPPRIPTPISSCTKTCLPSIDTIRRHRHWCDASQTRFHCTFVPSVPPSGDRSHFKFSCKHPATARHLWRTRSSRIQPRHSRGVLRWVKPCSHANHTRRKLSLEKEATALCFRGHVVE